MKIGEVRKYSKQELGSSHLETMTKITKDLQEQRVCAGAMKKKKTSLILGIAHFTRTLQRNTHILMMTKIL